MKRWMTVCTVSMIGAVFADGELETELLAGAKKPQQATLATMEPIAPQYDDRFGFSFDRLVFDHNKANCVYFGLDVWMPYFFSNNRNGHYGHLYEGEIRLGYNLFYNGCDHISPLFGVGYQYNNVGVFHNAKFAYTAAGFRYYHEFNTVFGWGLYLKGLAGQQLGEKEAKKFAWGVDLSMPFVFRFARARHWDITLEPFYLYMESHHKHQAVFGGRGTLGYQF
ncbi:MAG: hypothetical protein ACRDFB_04770 [Rhabdochlamydiaceae bacterium]